MHRQQIASVSEGTPGQFYGGSGLCRFAENWNAISLFLEGKFDNVESRVACRFIISPPGAMIHKELNQAKPISERCPITIHRSSSTRISALWLLISRGVQTFLQVV